MGKWRDCFSVEGIGRIKGKRGRDHRSKGLLLSVGAALGAIVAFFSDPRSGRRRRAVAGDRTAGFTRRTARSFVLLLRSRAHERPVVPRYALS